ncbi:MAG: DUF6884 domain-containing protein [Ktedonobacterales bacterium]
MARCIGLVVAPGRQRAGVMRASESYSRSPLFRRACDYCQRGRDEWHILSARHGLLSPQQVIGADELAFSILSPDERREWARRTATQLVARCERSGEDIVFVLYGPRQYVRLLQRAAPCLRFELPLAGVTARERARWFDERLRVCPRTLTPAPTPPPPAPALPAPPAPSAPSRSFWRLRTPKLSAALTLVGAKR